MGNSSPLRTYSPKRGNAVQEQSAQISYNVTQVNSKTTNVGAGSTANLGEARTAAMTATHSYGVSASNCAGQPTEKERLIAQLMKEAADLRQRERDYKMLQD